MRVGLIGVGLIGRSRLEALAALRGRGRELEVVGVLDPFDTEADRVASAMGSRTVADMTALLAERPDWVFVATPHDAAVELAARLLTAGVRVFLEKPLGRSSREAEYLVSLCHDEGQLVIGFNYRFYEGITELLRDVRRCAFGPLISFNAVIGHGGAPGMERGWKLDPIRAGGGALIDPGIHLLDLCLLISGETLEVTGGRWWSGFWRTGIEEECHLLLRAGSLPIADLQISIVRWRSTFRLELYGRDGYGIVEGRGRSYGAQTYRRGRRWAWRDGASQRDSEDVAVVTSGERVFETETEAALFPDPASVAPATGIRALEVMRLLDQCRASLGLPISTARG